MHSGPLAFLPLPEIAGLERSDGYCSIVWSVEDSKAQQLLTLDDTEFCVALGAAFEHRLGPIEAVDRRFSFPLQQRHAKHYVEPGFALVGDAAHTIHPLAGQGVNLGRLDVQALLEELRRAVRRDLPLADFSILQRYHRQRLGHNLAVMGLMEAFKRLFGSRNPAVHVARNWGMSQLNHLKPLKNLIAKQALGA
jgi:2-octaprenylphenol hydroxylase